jgi:hypothetical protein
VGRPDHVVDVLVDLPADDGLHPLLLELPVRGLEDLDSDKDFLASGVGDGHVGVLRRVLEVLVLVMYVVVVGLLAA